MSLRSWWSRVMGSRRPQPNGPAIDESQDRLVSWLQHTHETERAALARRLHDELGGLLTAARMDLSWLRQRLETTGDEAMRAKAAAIDAGLSEAMNLKRGVVDRLRPALLDHFGLATALQAHCEENCRRAGVAIDVQVDEAVSAIPSDLALALYRACETGLARMLRGPARHVELIAEVEEQRLFMTLRATGMSSSSTQDEALAVEILRHWIGRHSGTLEWTESGDGSAVLRADVPVPFNAGAEAPGSRSVPVVR